MALALPAPPGRPSDSSSSLFCSTARSALSSRSSTPIVWHRSRRSGNHVDSRTVHLFVCGVLMRVVGKGGGIGGRQVGLQTKDCSDNVPLGREVGSGGRACTCVERRSTRTRQVSKKKRVKKNKTTAGGQRSTACVLRTPVLTVNNRQSATTTRPRTNTSIQNNTALTTLRTKNRRCVVGAVFRLSLRHNSYYYFCCTSHNT